MKRSIFLSFILSLSLAACIPQAMAQKQSRIEKLLRYLNDNDLDKWQKGCEKLDEETQVHYAEELSLMSTLNDLWNKRNEQASIQYFGIYKKAMNAFLSSICEGENIQLSTLREKTNKSIVDILEASTNKIPFSRRLIDSIQVTGYPMDSLQMQKLQTIRELALMDEMQKSPASGTYRTYLTEYPKGKFIPQLYAAENTRLYQLTKKTPHVDNFKAFFENTDIQKFYNELSDRPYLTEVCTLYDDFLFHQLDSVKKNGNAATIRQLIDEYKNTSYLTPANRKYLSELEFLSEKTDFELLKPTIVSSESLPLLKDFLLNHKYKVFRDSANALRHSFIIQAIIYTPNTVNHYVQGRLMKCSEVDSTETTTTTYVYNEKGQPLSILSTTERNGQIINEAQTSLLYNPQGQCIFEVKNNPRTQTDYYRRTKQFGADGSIMSDSLKYMDGRLILSSYNKQGLLTESKIFNKGELQSQTINKYDKNGRLMESQHQNLTFVNAPSQVLSQKESYEYTKYGYLMRITYQRILGNNQKSSGYLTYMYDEYGNQIDGNSYYEYDNTGQWICRTNANSPKEVEQIQYIYK